MKKGPFVKKIKTKNALYIYDVISNQLIKVNQAVFDLIDHIGLHDTGTILEALKHRYSENEIRNHIKGIEDAKRQHNLFSSHRPAISSVYSSVEHVEKAMENNLTQLILEVTVSCNLRCKYCSFSGRYSNFRQKSRWGANRVLHIPCVNRESIRRPYPENIEPIVIVDLFSTGLLLSSLFLLLGVQSMCLKIALFLEDFTPEIKFSMEMMVISIIPGLSQDGNNFHG